MSCDQIPTALRWAHGELDDDAIVDHVVGCAHCSAAIVEEEAVFASIAPVLSHLAPAAPEPVVASPSPRRWVVLVALAAAAAVVVGLAWDRAPSVPEDTDAAAFVDDPAADVAAWNAVDADLEALDLELVELTHDLSSL